MHRVCSIIFFLITPLTIVSGITYSCSPDATCGCSGRPAVLTKIVGGEMASPQTWGWAASLRYTSSGSHFCGGSIISSTYILTAAHCTVDLPSASAVRVYVGSIYLSQETQVRTVSKIYNHPSYSPSTFLNDIAILKLSSPLDLDQTSVNLVCLPPISFTDLNHEEYPAVGINVMQIELFEIVSFVSVLLVSCHRLGSIS